MPPEVASSRDLGHPAGPHGASAALIEALARAIHYAHECGIVHRDLKPANIVLTEDRRAQDHRLRPGKAARAGGRRHGLRDDPGDPQLHGTRAVPRASRARSRRAADVYALGAILYEVLTGRPPFKGATPLSTLDQVANQEPLTPSKLQRNTPPDLETICMKCLEKDPSRRYPTAEALADDLRRFLDGRPILARPSPSWEKAAKWARRHPGLARALAASRGGRRWSSSRELSTTTPGSRPA